MRTANHTQQGDLFAAAGLAPALACAEVCATTSTLAARLPETLFPGHVLVGVSGLERARL